MADGGITRIEVEGFKSLAKKTSIDLRPLTILAGANSSGKSSIMQPLLLFKQTLDAPFDPGPLLMNGPHVRFTSSNQILPSHGRIRSFSFSTSVRGSCLTATFGQRKGKGFDLLRTRYKDGNRTVTLEPGMALADLQVAAESAEFSFGQVEHARLVRRRCIFEIHAKNVMLGQEIELPVWSAPADITSVIEGMIHLPGLRGNPERTYPTSGIGRSFPGHFDKYSPGVIEEWSEFNGDRITSLCEDLADLGLTDRVAARRINDTEIELLVARTRNGRDLVSIADVGLGVSQVLPVLVGLRVAAPQRLVYIEQPEIHLHPRAQHALAKPFAEAAKRKVTTVVETHSSLFLLGIQSLIAKGELDPKLVILHWFERDPKTGISSVKSVTPDRTGVFENWPVDFDDVSLQANREFIKASFAKSKAK